MEKILINWLSEYTNIQVDCDTTFKELNFDIFDEAVVVDFVKKTFNKNVNIHEIWFEKVGDLINAITKSP